MEAEFVFAGVSNAVMGGFDATDAASGVYRFHVTNTIPETVTIVVSIAGVDVGSATIVFLPVPNASHSSMVVEPDVVRADGTTFATLTVTVNDGAGNPLPSYQEGDFSFTVIPSTSFSSFAATTVTYSNVSIRDFDDSNAANGVYRSGSQARFRRR